MPAKDPNIHTGNSFRIMALLVSACLVTLTVLRILNVPMTIDECMPHAYMTRPYIDIISFAYPTANDHLLNTILRKFFIDLFADTPFWLRFDNLMAQLLFLWCSYRLCCRLFKNTAWQIVVFLLLNLHPVIVQFWGLSRGYGLAVALLTCSVYYLLCYVQDKKISALYVSLITASLAAYSNFSFLDYYFGIVLFMIVRHLLTRGDTSENKQGTKEILAITISSVLLLLLTADPISKLMAANELYYGGSVSLVQDTLGSLIKEDLYLDPTRLIVHLMAWFIVLSAIGIGICWCVAALKKKITTEMLTGIMFWVLLTTPAICIIAQHFLLHTLYPLDRTALYFIPLYILAITYFLYFIGPAMPVLSKVGLYTMLAVIVINFVPKINITTSHMWWFNANDLVVLNRMEDEHKSEDRKIRVCVDWLFAATFSYNVETKYSTRFAPPANFKHTYTKTDTSFDYYYISRERGLGNIPPNYVKDTSFLKDDFLLYRKVR